MILFFFFDKAKNSINVVRCSLNLIQKVSETKQKENDTMKLLLRSLDAYRISDTR